MRALIFQVNPTNSRLGLVKLSPLGRGRRQDEQQLGSRDAHTTERVRDGHKEASYEMKITDATRNLDSVDNVVTAKFVMKICW